MYFKIFISKSWRERFAGSRRRLIQSFFKNSVSRKGDLCKCQYRDTDFSLRDHFMPQVCGRGIPREFSCGNNQSYQRNLLCGASAGIP